MLRDCEDRASKGKDISPFHNLDEVVTGRLLCRPGQAKTKTTAVARIDTLNNKVELVYDVRYVCMYYYRRG